jgi:hypothetical protein
MLSKLNEQDHYRHMHLNHEAEVLQAAVQSLLQGVEGWQEGWPPDHATAVGDCPACGCATNIPKESVFECYVCGVRLVRELKVGVVQELTVGERVL